MRKTWLAAPAAACLTAAALAVTAGTGSPALAGNGRAAAPAAAGTATVIYACVSSTQHFFDVSVMSPPACPAGSYGVSWAGSAAPGPSPSPSPTATSPSPSPTSASPSPSPSTTSPSPSPTGTATGTACTRTSGPPPDNSDCGPYYYPADTASSGYNTYVGPDFFNPVPGESWSLSVTDPGSWHATVNVPDGNTSVTGYPSTGQNSSGDGTTQAITSYTAITSSFAEDMHATAGTDAEAAYDVWTAAGDETMIQFDFSALRPRCSAGAGDPVLAVVPFTEPGTGTAQDWDFCQYGSERIWQLHGGSEQSGSVDIRAMLTWEISHGYLPSGAQLGLTGFGFEICSTGGVLEDFTVSRFTLTALPNP